MTTTITGAEEVTWDLADLYQGPEDPRIEQDLAEVKAGVTAFGERYRGKVDALDAAGLAEAVTEAERLGEILNRLTSFASLRFSTDTSDAARGAFLQRMREESTRIRTEMLFFELDWVALDDQRATELLADEALARYAHYLRSQRRYRLHRRSEPEERIMTELGVVGAGAWSRLFTETTAAMRVEIDGERVALEEALSRLHRPVRDDRRRAAEGLTHALTDQIRLRTSVFNTILLDAATRDRLRDYPHWLRSRNLANEISDEAVDALVEAVVGRYDIPHRYYALKARLLGLDRLADYDRMAELSGGGEHVPWEEARSIVEGAYGDFSPVTGGIIRDFFDRRWIDAAPGEGKEPGAFCATTIPLAHPYMLMTYTGERRAVLVLAHELGHGVHGVLASPLGLYNASVPLTMAETASVFGEALTFKRLLASETEPRGRLELLVGHLDDAVATVFRQIAMNRFEDKVHNARRETGELAPDDFARMWIDTQEAVLGDAVEISEGYRWWWSYVPHFISVPGYVYAYAFGYLFSLAIFRRYEEDPSMTEPYLDLLRAGGSRAPEDLAGIVGLDLRDPGFWSAGLEAIDETLREAEKLAVADAPDRRPH